MNVIEYVEAKIQKLRDFERDWMRRHAEGVPGYESLVLPNPDWDEQFDLFLEDPPPPLLKQLDPYETLQNRRR